MSQEEGLKAPTPCHRLGLTVAAAAVRAGGRDFSMRQDMMSRAVNDLEGRRLVVCDEVGSDLCLSDDKFKQITGGGDTSMFFLL